MNPLSVSCVIPCFNGAPTLQRTARSALAQDHLGDCIVVDDASTDDSAAVAADLQKGDSRVRVIRLACNLGQASARNIGAALTTSELLVFLDSDDEYLPGFFARAVGLFGKHPECAAIKTGIEVVNLPADLPLADDDPRYNAAVFSSGSNLVVRRSVFWAVGGFPVGSAFRRALGGEDIALNNALQANFGMSFVRRKCLRVHNRPGSHLEQYLRRTRAENGEVVFVQDLPEEQDGSWLAAQQAHQARAAADREQLARLTTRSRARGG